MLRSIVVVLSNLAEFYCRKLQTSDRLTVAQIHAEIRAAQKSPVADGDVRVGSSYAAWMMKIFVMLPQFVRNLFFWQPLFHDPFRFKRTMGNVSVTSLSMFVRIYWCLLYKVMSRRWVVNYHWLWSSRIDHL